MGFEFYYLDILLKGSFKLSVPYRLCGCVGAVMLMAFGHSCCWLGSSSRGDSTM